MGMVKSMTRRELFAGLLSLATAPFVAAKSKPYLICHDGSTGICGMGPMLPSRKLIAGGAKTAEIIDLRANPDQASKYIPTRCFVDGVEIKQVWYADVKNGVVKSFDVFGDGRSHHSLSLPQFRHALNIKAVIVNGERAEVLSEVPGGHGILSKTIRGKVELIRP